MPNLGGRGSSCVWCGEWSVQCSHFPFKLFLFSFIGVGRGCPSKQFSSSWHVPQRVPNSTSLYPICFGKCCPPFTYYTFVVWFMLISSWVCSHLFFFSFGKAPHWLATLPTFLEHWTFPNRSSSLDPQSQNKNKGVCHTLALPFTLKSILRQKKNYENSNISPCKNNIIFKKIF